MGELLKRGVAPGAPPQLTGIDFTLPSTLVNYNNGYPQNVRIQNGEIRKREGMSILGVDSVPIVGENGVQHLAVYPTEEEEIRLIRCSKQRVQKFNSGSRTWDDITGSEVLIGGDDNYWDHAIAEGKLILSNYVNSIYKWADGDVSIAALGGSPPNAKYLMYLAPYLIAGYLGSGANKHLKVQWPTDASIEDWSGLNSGSALLADDAEPIRGMRTLNEFGVAYKKNSIYLARKVSTADILLWNLQESGVGLMNHRCVVDRQGRHYFMGLNDFHVFNGVRSESIGRKVRERVFRFRNPEADTRHHALHMADMSEIWWYVRGSSDTWPTQVWKYNYEYDVWYYDIVRNIRAAALWYNQSSVMIDQLVGTIDEQAGMIDDYLQLTNSPAYIFADNLGLTYVMDPSSSNDNALAIEGRWDSMDFTAEIFEAYKRWLWLDIWASGNEITVYYSTDEGQSWKKIERIELTSQNQHYRLDFDVVADKVRFRFENNVAGSTFSLRQIQPYYIVREDMGR